MADIYLSYTDLSGTPPYVERLSSREDYKVVFEAAAALSLTVCGVYIEPQGRGKPHIYLAILTNRGLTLEQIALVQDAACRWLPMNDTPAVEIRISATSGCGVSGDGLYKPGATRLTLDGGSLQRPRLAEPHDEGQTP